MQRVCFAGITGWTAPPIVAAIDATDDLILIVWAAVRAGVHVELPGVRRGLDSLLFE